MKQECILRNLRSERGYKLVVDTDQNLLNNIRVWCMNNSAEMAYYLEPDLITQIRCDIWPENLNIHAVYYYKGIKHDFDEKTVLKSVLPEAANVELGMECNGYIPGDNRNTNTDITPVLQIGEINKDHEPRLDDVFEPTSGSYFYDSDADSDFEYEKYHTVEDAPSSPENDKSGWQTPDNGADSTQKSSKSNQQHVNVNNQTIKSNATNGSSSQPDPFESEESKSSTSTSDKTKNKLPLILIPIACIVVLGAWFVLKPDHSKINDYESVAADNSNIIDESAMVDNNTTADESVNFSEILSKETSASITGMYENDFDGNGTVEAFATTVSDLNPEDEDLWFISDQGATSVAGTGHVPQLIYTNDDVILVPWRAGYGATICYSVYHGQVKELEIYKADIFQADDMTIYAVEEYFTSEGF